MTKEELYEKSVAMLPVKRVDGDNFREVLQKALNQYVENVKQLDQSERLDDDYLEIIERICKSIREIVDLKYKGLHSKAYNELGCLLRTEFLKTTLFNSFDRQIGDLSECYRIRKIENKRGVTCKDMFHIPLSKRGIVTTQRYSVPGYPCLYMGESIYGCWEEMGRPSLDLFMVSRLRQTLITHLLDLRIPLKKDFINKVNISKIVNFPLIIACMISVGNYNDSFKSEYIIPQLLMEYIIENYSYDKKNSLLENKIVDLFSFLDNIHGIYYTSVHKNDDFDFPKNKFDNVVIPIVDSSSNTDYCSVLSKLFQITEPTCEEHERIKGTLYSSSNSTESTPETNYQNSVFGRMEDSLQKAELHSIAQIP